MAAAVAAVLMAAAPAARADLRSAAFDSPVSATSAFAVEPLADGFVKDTVFRGLTAPTKVRFAPDGRVFVAQADGLVLVYDGLDDSTPSTFADLRTQVAWFGDRGLLGMALDPEFDDGRPYVYVLYTYDGAPGQTAPRWNDSCPDPPGLDVDGCVVSGRLSRLDANGAEHVLIADEWCQQYSSHSIGDLNFGPDGALYVSGGDGASFVFADYGQDGTPRNPCGDPPGGVGGAMTPPGAEGGSLRSQDVRTPADPTGLNGAVLRVDPDTGAPLPDNPGTGDADARRIVAYGFRNPFRFAFRPGTTDLYVADVGLYQWEEINRQPSPATAVRNYGWPCYEGASEHLTWYYLGVKICQDLYRDENAAAPLYAYGHNERVAGESCQINGSSISAMTFYDGASFDSSYRGALFFGDYSRSCIWVMFPGANGVPDPATRRPFDQDAGFPVDLEVGPGGALFYVDIAQGSIERISAVDANEEPTAVATTDRVSGPRPLTVQFDASESSDPNRDALTYAWDLDGDGAYDDSTAVAPSFTYTTNGSRTVKLRVTDTGGATSTDQLQIMVGSPPAATITSPGAGHTYAVGETVAFAGGAVDGDGAPMLPTSLTWTIEIHHCHALAPANCHAHLIQTLNGAAASSIAFPDHDYPSYVTLTLKATDGDGLTDTDVVRIDPKTVDLTFRSDPGGVPLTVGGEAQAAPFTRTVMQNGTVGVSAPVTTGSYDFASWSQGGAAAQQLQAPATPATYAATYTPSPCATAGGLVGAWGFDEANGTSVLDASGQSNNGTLAGATRTADGRFGGALTFNGTSHSVTVPDSNSLDLTAGMTLEAWVNPVAGGGSYGWHQAVLKERPAGMAYGLYTTADTGRPSAHAFTSGERQAHSSTALPLNSWSHVAATYDGTTVRVWVNGVETGSAAAPAPIVTSTGVLRFGGNGVWGEWFAGRLDEVRVYNRALSPAELQTTMTKPVSCAVTPALAVAPASVAFSDATPKTLAVTNAGGGSLAFTASVNVPWLTVTPTSGTAPRTLTVTPAYDGLGPGTHSATITITGANTSRTVAVTVSVPEPPRLAVAPASLSFSDGTAKTLTVSNAGGGALSFTAAADVPWLSVTPQSGSAPRAVTVTPSPAGLSPGIYTGAVTVTATGVDGSPVTVPVTLTVPAPPELAVVPAGLAFRAVQGMAAPAAKTLDVSNLGGGALAFTASTNVLWLTVAPGSATAPRTLTVTAATSALPAGEYTASVTITAPGVPGSPRAVPVTLTVDPPPPLLAVSPVSLSFTDGSTKSLTVSNAGGGALDFTASANVPWLAVTPASGSAPGTLTVTPSLAGLSPGTHTGTVTVTAAGASGSPKAITVTLTIAPPPALAVAPASLSFSDGTAKTLAVSNAGGGSLGFSVSDDAPWLAVTPASGSAPATLTVTPTLTGLSPGTYTATVTILAAGVSGSPKSVPVTLTVPAGTPGLVGAWGFEEASGTIVTDRSGLANPGTIEGATRTTAGRFGSALSFDGVNDRVTVAASASLGLRTAVTMEAWVYPTVLGTFRTVLMREQANGLTYAIYGSTSTGRPSVNISTTSEQDLRGTANLALNTWSHVAATWDATTLRLYVNGTQRATRTLTGTMPLTSAPLRFGGNGPWGEWFAGRLDEIRVYDRALTAAQVTADMNAPVGG